MFYVFHLLVLKNNYYCDHNYNDRWYKEREYDSRFNSVFIQVVSVNAHLILDLHVLLK